MPSNLRATPPEGGAKVEVSGLIVIMVTTQTGRGSCILKLLIIVLALIPIGTGIFGVVSGLTVGPGSWTARAAYFDSEYRFLNGVWFGAGVALIWAARDLQRRRHAAIFVLLLIGCGTLARLIGCLTLGAPPLPFMIALGVELTCVPAAAFWIVRLPKQ